MNAPAELEEMLESAEHENEKEENEEDE